VLADSNFDRWLFINHPAWLGEATIISTSPKMACCALLVTAGCLEALKDASLR
jgi:hypothetical protein